MMALHDLFCLYASSQALSKLSQFYYTGPMCFHRRSYFENVFWSQKLEFMSRSVHFPYCSHVTRLLKCVFTDGAIFQCFLSPKMGLFVHSVFLSHWELTPYISHVNVLSTLRVFALGAFFSATGLKFWFCVQFLQGLACLDFKRDEFIRRKVKQVFTTYFRLFSQVRLNLNALSFKRYW